MNHDQGFDDSSIPVLTEVVRETPSAPASADAAVAEVVLDEAPAEPVAAAAAPAEVAPAASLEERAATALSADEWGALELRLTEHILEHLQGRVDFVLQQRLRDSMADVMQHALAGLTEEIRNGLSQTIEQIVSRAVAQELAHLKTSRS
ncbi:hypothetical protein NX773_01690 [Massilia solisilvae]|uniref:DUF2486 family protein n=1 Tax=Massilia solisilvae TaxID=1811225 RepID=A0ABT2BED4_9BURK|nr:hypothetical protein [Massilia solisilvae]MCS0606876.1 hypothetical protein [Massilia solisilvae]